MLEIRLYRFQADRFSTGRARRRIRSGLSSVFFARFGRLVLHLTNPSLRRSRPTRLVYERLHPSPGEKLACRDRSSTSCTVIDLNGLSCISSTSASPSASLVRSVRLSVPGLPFTLEGDSVPDFPARVDLALGFFPDIDCLFVP